MVDAALILHNFIEREGDHWEAESEMQDDREETEIEMEHTISCNLAKTEGEKKRMELMKIVLQTHGYVNM